MNSLWLSGLNIVGRGAQFFMFLVIASAFGISSKTDAVYQVYTPIMTVGAVLSGVADVFAINYLSNAKSLGCFVSSVRYLAKNIGFLAVLISFSLILILVVAGYSVFWMLAMSLIPILLLLSALMGQALNVSDAVKTAALAPIAGILIALGTVALGGRGSAWLAVVLIGYEVGRCFFLCFTARRLLFPAVNTNRPGLPMVPLNFHSYKGLAAWQLVAGTLMGLIPIINLYFSTVIGGGAVTVVEYASKLWNLVPLLLSGPITYLSLDLSQRAAQRNIQRNFLHKNALILFVLAVFFVVPIVVFRFSVVDFIYMYSSMGATHKHAMSNLLALFLMGAPFYVAGLVYVRALSACGRSNLAAVVCLINVLVTLAINSICRDLGLPAIGFAHVAMYFVALLVLLMVTKNAKIMQFTD